MFQQTHFSFFSSFTIFYKFPPYSLGINMQHICKRTRFRFFFDILKFFHILSFYYVEEVKKYRTRKRIISKRGLYSWIMNTPGVSRARCNKNNILRPMDSIVKALNWNEEKKMWKRYRKQSIFLFYNFSISPFFQSPSFSAYSAFRGHYDEYFNQIYFSVDYRNKRLCLVTLGTSETICSFYARFGFWEQKLI